MALFPIIGLAYFAAVVSLLAAGAGEEGDVGDTAVGAARGHGGHAGESSLTMAWLQSQLAGTLECSSFYQASVWGCEET